MTRHETVHSEFTQEEKRQVLRDTLQGRRDLKNTYLARANPDEGGRFAAQSARYTVGTEAVPRYPAGPTWGADPTGVEPPIGIDVNAVEAVGTAQEVEQSLARSGGKGVGMNASALLPSDRPSGNVQRADMGPLQSRVGRLARRRRSLKQGKG